MNLAKSIARELLPQFLTFLGAGILLAGITQDMWWLWCILIGWTVGTAGGLIAGALSAHSDKRGPAKELKREREAERELQLLRDYLNGVKREDD